jgi:hypothetical protein
MSVGFESGMVKRIEKVLEESKNSFIIVVSHETAGFGIEMHFVFRTFPTFVHVNLH